jgi:hypothetical protein
MCKRLQSYRLQTSTYIHLQNILELEDDVIVTRNVAHFVKIDIRQSQSQSYFTIGGLRPISSSSRQTSWDPRPDFFFSTEHLQLHSLCNVLSDEWIGLPFTIAAGFASAIII